MSKEIEEKELLKELLERCFHSVPDEEGVDWSYDEGCNLKDEEPELSKKLLDYAKKNKIKLIQ